MRMYRLDFRLTASLVAALVLTVAVACGGDDPTPTTGPGDPTSTPDNGGSEPTATATPEQSDDLPAPGSPVGTVAISVARVAAHPGINSANGGEGSVWWGAGESLFTTSEGPVFGEPWLAQEWEIAEDLSKVTIQLQEGVQFHGDWGEMTAEDVAWSINDANAAINLDSIHAQAGDLAAVFGEWVAVDEYTVDAPFTTFDPRWQTTALSDGFQPTGIFSKRVFDEQGRDWMLENTIMTGPFSVQEWTDGGRAVLNAVDDHWRQTPQIDTIIYDQIPDAAIRLARMRTGETDAAAIELKDIPGLLEEGFLLSGTGSGSELNIAFSGNLWETHHAVTGEELARPGLNPERPWIGDPADEESMERARKVRWALAMGYDREELNEVLIAGQGWPHSIGYFNPEMPEYQDKWDVPYDPDAALEMLAEAGYEDGFEVEIFGQTDTLIRLETAEAVAGFWSRDLDLDVSVNAFEYRVFRPSIVDRSAEIPFMNSCDDGRYPRPWDWPVGLIISSLSRGGFSCALEAPTIAENFLASASEPDLQERIRITNETADYLHHQMLLPGTFTIPVILPYNPNAIAEWDMRPSLGGPISSPEMIVPAR
ncbi:MAG: ABC transporter substrate-binding protein [Dehalococcoidia bacterium]